MNGICKLCHKKADLKLSHIIPKFIYRWLKETSATGYLRLGQNPNVRVQDGFKESWLCGECEDLLSKWETEFANKLFYPLVQRKKNSFEYRAWLLKFVVSLSWRALIYMKEIGLPHFSEEQRQEVNPALEVWRNFLLGSIKNPDKYQQHLIPVGIIERHSMPNLPTNINRYLLRNIDLDLLASNNQAFVYIKIPYFIFIGGIQIKPEQWRNTMLHVHKGSLGVKHIVVPQSFGDYLIERAARVAKIQKSMSEKQRTKIEDNIKNNIENLAESETFKAFNSDVELFGQDVFDD